MSKQKKTHKTKQCCFCGLSEDDEVKYGKIHECDDVSTHYYCLLLSSNMEQKGKDDEGILGFLTVDIHKEIRRGKKLNCSYCKKNGATLGCCNSKCKRIFHFPCGLNNGALNQFFGEFRSYCMTHRPMQKIDPYVKAEIKSSNEVLCCICYDKVNPEDSITTLWAPCCKKNAWFHKKCVQQLALSAGYFFKCPLCNNTNQFQKAMKEHGIYIPSQDASWELEPNAFQELLHRHDHCDAHTCLCPKGRKYTSNNAKWELILCRTCGSQGIHMACGKLKWANPLWSCKECSSILSRSNRANDFEVKTDMIDSGSDTDSDSDISVGMELPVFNDHSPILSNISSSPPIRLRPGPMSYKLRQIDSHKMNRIAKLKDIESPERNGIIDVDEQPTPRCSSDTILTEDNSTDNKEIEKTESPQPLDTSKSDIITIDSDDEINDIPPKNSTSPHSVNGFPNAEHKVFQMNHLALLQSYHLEELNNGQYGEIQENDSSSNCLSDIKISNVTSLSHEMYTSVPEENSQNSWTSDDYLYNNTITVENDNATHVSLKRKADDSPVNQSRNTFKRVKINEFRNSAETESLPLTSASSSKTFLPHTNIQVLNQDNEATNSSGFCNSEVGKLSFGEDFNDSETDTQLMEETICDMYPLFLEEEELQDARNLIMCSSNAETNGRKVLKQVDSGDMLQNSPETSTKYSTVPDVKDHYNQSLECTGNAGTSLALGPADSGGTSDEFNDMGTELCSKTEVSSSPTECSKTLQSDSPEPASKVQVQAQNSFNSSAANSSNCDRSRIIRDAIPLKDLKFRVRNSNTLEVILYDTFLVNIPIKNSSNYRSSSSDLHGKYSEAQMNSFTNNGNSSDHSGNVNDCAIDALKFPLVNNKDACKFEPYIREDIVSNNDDTKENLNPITTAVNNLSCSSQHETTETTKVLTSKMPFEQDNRTETNVLPSSTNTMENVTEHVTRQHVKSCKEMNKSSGKLQTESNELQATSRLRIKNFKNVNHVTSSTEDHESTDSRIRDNGGTDICRFRISIDLYKVRNVIGTNPTVYSKTDIDNQQNTKVDFTPKIPALKLSNLTDTRVVRRSVESTNNHTNFRRKTHQSRNCRSRSNQNSEERTSRNTNSSERLSSRISLQNIEQSKLRWGNEHSEKQHTSTR